MVLSCPARIRTLEMTESESVALPLGDWALNYSIESFIQNSSAGWAVSLNQVNNRHYTEEPIGMQVLF